MGVRPNAWKSWIAVLVTTISTSACGGATASEPADAAPDEVGTDDSGPAPVACRDAAPDVSCNGVAILASNYDQTCQVDNDCILIGEGVPCTPCSLAYGPYGAINRGAVLAVEADVAKTPGADLPESCIQSCTPDPVPCCQSGRCGVCSN